METMGWIVVGFQLTSHHHATGLIEERNDKKEEVGANLVVVDSNDRLRVDSSDLVVNLLEGQARQFVDNRLLSLKLGSFESHAALICVHIRQF